MLQHQRVSESCPRCCPPGSPGRHNSLPLPGGARQTLSPALRCPLAVALTRLMSLSRASGVHFCVALLFRPLREGRPNKSRYIFLSKATVCLVGVSVRGNGLSNSTTERLLICLYVAATKWRRCAPLASCNNNRSGECVPKELSFWLAATAAAAGAPVAATCQAKAHTRGQADHVATTTLANPKELIHDWLWPSPVQLAIVVTGLLASAAGVAVGAVAPSQGSVSCHPG